MARNYGDDEDDMLQLDGDVGGGVVRHPVQAPEHALGDLLRRGVTLVERAHQRARQRAVRRHVAHAPLAAVRQEPLHGPEAAPRHRAAGVPAATADGGDVAVLP